MGSKAEQQDVLSIRCACGRKVEGSPTLRFLSKGTGRREWMFSGVGDPGKGLTLGDGPSGHEEFNLDQTH